jgi:hypothetical protein
MYIKLGDIEFQLNWRPISFRLAHAAPPPSPSSSTAGTLPPPRAATSHGALLPSWTTTLGHHRPFVRWHGEAWAPLLSGSTTASSSRMGRHLLELHGPLPPPLHHRLGRRARYVHHWASSRVCWPWRDASPPSRRRRAHGGLLQPARGGLNLNLEHVDGCERFWLLSILLDHGESKT